MAEEHASFETTWAGAMRRLAAASGAVVALAALLYDVPLRIAVLRGGAVTVGLLLVVRYGAPVLARAGARRAPPDQEGSEAAHPLPEKDTP